MLKVGRVVEVYFPGAPADCPFRLYFSEYGELLVGVLPGGALKIFTEENSSKDKNEWVFANGAWDSVFTGMRYEEIPD